MFEDSLITSGISADQRRNAKRTRWITLTSIAIQGTVLTAFVVVPLIWPETLPLVSVAPKMTSITMKKPEVKIQPKPLPIVTSSNAVSAPSQPQRVVERSGGVIQHGPAIVAAAEYPAVDLHIGMGTGPLSVLGPGGPGNGTGSAPVVVAATTKSVGPVRISDMAKGMLLEPIRPVYPRIAIMAHIEGTVVITATIDKHGRITGLQVVSGPEMLRQAAADAIRDARYKPYVLNNEPIDVITTISVNFRLGAT
jgi:protein TonB